MLGRGSFASTCLLASLLGIASLAFAQQSGDAQSTAPQQDAPAVAPAPADPELANQVQQLQAEVDQLKAQVAQLNSVVEQLQSERATVQAAPPAAAAEKGAPKKSVKKGPAPSAKGTAAPAIATPSPSAPDDSSPMTVLVFHDGHRTEARNYAIVGQTLWIYTQDESQKVPLSDLDVAATKNANSDRGIIFQMPASH